MDVCSTGLLNILAQPLHCAHVIVAGVQPLPFEIVRVHDFRSAIQSEVVDPSEATMYRSPVRRQGGVGGCICRTWFFGGKFLGKFGTAVWIPEGVAPGDAAQIKAISASSRSESSCRRERPMCSRWCGEDRKQPPIFTRSSVGAVLASRADAAGAQSLSADPQRTTGPR
eukprot:903754-Rhodomonas_salina.1